MTRMDELELEISREYGGPTIGAWPRYKGDRLRPHVGGGGGGGGGDDARKMEEERLARVQAATDSINAIFNNKVQKQQQVYKDSKGNVITPEEYALRMQEANAKAKKKSRIWDGPNLYGSGSRSFSDRTGSTKSGIYDFSPATTTTWVDGDPANSRERLYEQQRQNVYELNSRDVNRQAQEAERTNRFGLARSGLLGGSVDIDSNADINRRTNDGLIRAGSIGDQAAADLRMQDEQTRSSLISLAQSGVDTGTAATMALKGLEANASNASGARGAASVGQLFNDLSGAYLYNQQMQGAQAGYNQPGGQVYGVSSTRKSYAGTP